MSEKWEQRDRMIIARLGVAIITIDAVTPKLAHQIVTAHNNHEPLVKALDWLMKERCKLMDEDGNCLCGEQYACDAPALLAEIKKDTP